MKKYFPTILDFQGQIQDIQLFLFCFLLLDNFNTFVSLIFISRIFYILFSLSVPTNSRSLFQRSKVSPFFTIQEKTKADF